MKIENRAHRAAMAVLRYGFVAATAVSAWQYWSGKGNEVSVPPVAGTKPSLAVTTSQATVSTIPMQVPAQGRIRAVESVAVSSTLSGRIVDEVLVAEGDWVEKGDVLARLDRETLETDVQQQEAALATARANHAEAKLAKDRAASLYGKGAGTKSSLEAAETALLVAEAAVDQALALLETAKITLDKTVIRAPSSGFVVSEPIAEGSLVQTGTEILTIMREGKIELRARLPEQYLSGITPGMKATVKLLDGRLLDGVVTSADLVIDEDSKLGTVRISVPDMSASIGMYASAVIDAGEKKVLSVPASAVSYRNGSPVVFVVDEGNRVSLRKVGIGRGADGKVEITDGLQAGEKIVDDGVGLVNDGNLVLVADKK